MNHLKFGATTLVVLLLMSCTKIDTLPDETIVGDNTFGYVLDGQSYGSPFAGENDVFTFGDSVIAITSDSRYKLTTWNNEAYKVLSFSLSHDGAGAFSFTGATYEVLNNVYNTKGVYSMDSTLTNFVEITFVDYEQKILSGNFELTFEPLYSIISTHNEYADTTDTSENTYRANFTDGRFDLKVTD
ncbi:MAG: hypothetical protein GQ574_21290 [Crocinitomix sp.]|nr:hypothetical protein [Crocinitomix sp.]